MNKNLTAAWHFKREKFYADTFENPIQNAVFKQCPDLYNELNDPYAIQLSGVEILNMLCEKNCTRFPTIETHQKGKIGRFLLWFMKDAIDLYSKNLNLYDILKAKMYFSLYKMC